MLAFFIATDPVSASTTVKGRLVFGALLVRLVFIIRSWGGFLDGVAFAVLANMCVPLIDYYTKPVHTATKGADIMLNAIKKTALCSRFLPVHRQV